MEAVNVRALSIVFPAVDRIITGLKTVEIRSWDPPELPMLDLALVENRVYLREDGQEDPNGLLRAIVDVTGLHKWTEDEASAMGKEWSAGYVCWELSNVRPVEPAVPCPARRRIYELKIECPLPIRRR